MKETAAFIFYDFTSEYSVKHIYSYVFVCLPVLALSIKLTEMSVCVLSHFSLVWLCATI